MKKALIVRLSSLGDVVLSSVLIDPLLRRGYQPYLLTFKPYDQLFEDDWRVFAIGTTREELLEESFLDRIRAMNFNLFIDVHKNLRTFMLRKKLGGKWLAYRKDTLRRRLAIKISSLRKPYYVTESYLGVFRDLSEEDSPFPRIIVSEERLERLSELIPADRFVAFGAGARYRKKMYPRFRELAGMLTEIGFEVVWLGDERDRELIGEVEGINLCGRLSLVDVLGVIKLSEVFVGNDSGLLHCARAVGTPAVQIYGGTHPTLGFALYPEEGRVILKNLDCQPCDLHGKGECERGDYSCLDIDPALILSETLKLLPQVRP